MDIILKDYMGSCVLKETKKTTTMKMVTVDKYMEENQLNEMEFRHHLFNQSIQLFAWVSNFPMITLWPTARYQIKNLELVPWSSYYTGYVDLFRSRRRSSNYPAKVSAHGLIGLSKGIVLSALDNGSVELAERSLKRDISITKHTVLMDSKCRLEDEFANSIKGWLPYDIPPFSSKRAGRLEDYPSDLFEDNHLKAVIGDINPSFDFRAWRRDDAYREEKIEHVKSTFEAVIDEYKFKPKSFLDQPAYVPTAFEEGKPLSEVISLPDGGYRLTGHFGSSKIIRYSDLDPNECRLEIKMPPPVISRSQLIVFDFNEDMYSIGGEVNHIMLQDDLAQEELENEHDDQIDLYTNEKRLLLLKGWLGANKKEASDDLNITRKNLWNELSEIDDKIFPPASIGTIEGFFKFQDLCKFKKGRRPGN
jgi:hypothetical protein